jgi:hypothetical protein
MPNHKALCYNFGIIKKKKPLMKQCAHLSFYNFWIHSMKVIEFRMNFVIQIKFKVTKVDFYLYWPFYLPPFTLSFHIPWGIFHWSSYLHFHIITFHITWKNAREISACIFPLVIIFVLSYCHLSHTSWANGTQGPTNTMVQTSVWRVIVLDNHWVGYLF